ncbi:MAG: hypothetical protein JOZ05_20345 [Acetobacteraceae bacterium]|nr:hypothetical protein [Acetobacteraceae bacterium]
MTAMLAAEGSANVIRFQGRQETVGFTSRDLMDLQSWESDGCRLEVQPVADRVGQLAMIYQGEAPWASWALSREGSRILLWDCVSLADLGRFDCIRHALAAVPGGTPAQVEEPQSAEVIPFSRLLARRSAA